MKPIILLTTILISISCISQKPAETNEMKVKQVVNQFFDSLNKQDTALYKEILFLEGQIWTINNTTKSSSMSMRFFHDDLGGFNPDEIWEEIPLSFDINIHKGIAMAWVPYEFKVNGKFTHCGIDIFTLAETNEGWKIINASYTKYLEGCNDLKN